MTPARGNRGMEGGGGGEGGGGVEGGLKNTSPLTGKNSSSSSSSISSLGRRSMIGDDIRKGLGLDAPSPPSSSSSSSLEARLGGSGATAATPVKTSGSSTIISNSDSSSSSSSSGSSNNNKPLPPSISQSAPSPTPTATAAQQQRRQRAKDQKIFKKIVDSQTTAAVRLMGRREGGEDDLIWNDMRRDAEMECRKEPLLVSSMYASILNHRSLEQAVSFHMATKLATPSLIGTQIEGLFRQCFEEEPSFSEAIRQDMIAVMDRDPACRSYLDALLYFKGFQALQAHRVAHWLWKTGRDTLAFFLQSQINQLFQIDIHPAARIGSGVFIDHGTGIVIGETAVVGHNVSMLHMVTLGGSGKKHVDRHPKIGDGVLLGAGATILGNVQVGKGSLVGACSLVLEDIGPNSVAVGVPAKVVGQTTDLAPAQSMRQADAIAMVEDEEGASLLIECTDGTTAPTDDRGEMKDHWGIEAGLSTSGSSSSNYRSSYQYGGSGRSPSPSITNKQVLCGFVALGLIFSLPSLSSSYSSRRERSIDPLQQPYDPTRSVWDFKIIADLDQQSRDANASKPLFKSHLIEGILLRDLTPPNKYTVQWGASHVLQSAHNEAGRGMELSELISYKG
ncbi:serine o-acetyltransferase [Nannochloropsis oceanica]